MALLRSLTTPLTSDPDSPRSWRWWGASDGAVDATTLTVTDDPPQNTWCGPLTWTERLLGFVICIISGSFITVVAFHNLGAVFVGRPQKFAVGYTLGNMLSLAGTTFLMGPVRQWQAMTGDKQRVYATAAYLSSLLLTIISLYAAVPLLVVLFALSQWIALLWYSLTYARGLLASMVPTSLFASLW